MSAKGRDPLLECPPPRVLSHAKTKLLDGMFPCDTRWVPQGKNKEIQGVLRSETAAEQGCFIF